MHIETPEKTASAGFIMFDATTDDSNCYGCPVAITVSVPVVAAVAIDVTIAIAVAFLCCSLLVQGQGSCCVLCGWVSFLDLRMTVDCCAVLCSACGFCKLPLTFCLDIHSH